MTTIEEELTATVETHLNDSISLDDRENAVTQVKLWLNKQRTPGSDEAMNALMVGVRRLCDTLSVAYGKDAMKIVCRDPDGNRALVLLRAGSTWFLGGDVDSILINAVLSS